MAITISLASVDGTFFPSSRPQGFRPFRVWKRRSKLKPTIRPRKLALCRIRNQLDPSNFPSQFDDFFQGLLSHLPNPVNPLPLTALGFASGLAFSLSDKLNLKQKNLKSSKAPQFSNFGEWILFTSPTPFNRFVLLRCPSLLFEDGEFLKDVNDRLVKQERHFVRLDSGMIQLRTDTDGNNDEKEEGPERVKKPLMEYSRICVQTDDGGVVSLDWPANLGLNEERGLDSTILLIPGSAEGSMGENVRSFAFECLKKGFFPVVMNPRGCAGSPLTTPRLFSAADSDDIASAIRYLSRARPWSTFMGVGWGYGANMLTKYLAEVGEKTPLTAAACIDNPFDLEEATRSSTTSNAIKEKLLEGLKDILRLNKELFQGRSKPFDIEEALTAKSVRGFEAVISMVSNGFDTVEEFYEKSSTRSVVGDLKVPVLFIQSDDGTVPLFSVPRGMIAENPFSSLLLCSSSPSDVAESSNFVMSWSQELAVEWLAAVELALLKGRHPLLKDLDVTVNPSTGLALVDGSDSDEDETNGVVDITRSDNLNGYMLSPVKEFSGADYSSNFQGVEDGYQYGKKDFSQEGLASQPETELVNEESTDDPATETGQVLQTAQVVMHMLDVTMPGTLQEENKAKVLHAVGQGETLINALQDAVPEDVRDKLTSSVDAILLTHGKNLNFDTLNIDKIANISSDLKMKIERRLSRKASDEYKDDDGNSPDQKVKASDENKDDDGNSSDQKVPLNDHTDVHGQSQEKSTSHFDADDPESANSNGVPSSENKDINGSHGSALLFEHNENSHHTPDNADLSTQHVKPSGQAEGSTKNENRHENGESAQQETKQNINKESNINDKGLSEDRKILVTGVDEAGTPANPPDTHPSTPSKKPSGEEEGNTKKDDKHENGESAELEKNQDINSEVDLRSQGVSEDTKILATGVDEDVDSVNPPNARVSTERVKPSGQEEGSSKKDNKHENGESDQLEMVKQDINSEGDFRNQGLSEDKKILPGAGNEVVAPANPPDIQLSEKHDDDGNKNEERSVQMNSEQNKPASGSESSSFSVSQALDTFTDLDDSTQVAVNSVFGVIEEMIDQLDNKKEDSETVRVKNATSDGHPSSVPKVVNSRLKTPEDGRNLDEVMSSVPIDNNSSDGPLGSNTTGVTGEVKVHDTHEPSTRELVGVNAYPECDHHMNSVSKLEKVNNLDVDTAATLSLDYLPKERQWKLLGHQNCDSSADSNYETPNAVNNTNSEVGIVGSHSKQHIHTEPAYMIIDSERQNQHGEELESTTRLSGDYSKRAETLDEFVKLTEGVVLQSLKDEVVRRLCMYGTQDIHPDIASEIEEVVNAVSLAVRQDKGNTWSYRAHNLTNSSQFDGSQIIEAISAAIKTTRYLKQMLPVGVIVGSSLASLKKFYDAGSKDYEFQHEDWHKHQNGKDKGNLKRELLEIEGSHPLPVDEDGNSFPDQQLRRDRESDGSNRLGVEEKNLKIAGVGAFDRDTVMVGAVTAALGASALMTHEQDTDGASAIGQNQVKSFEQIENFKRSLTGELEDAAAEKQQTNIVTSLAEKAMSVAAPVVPTKEDGEFDQERVVSMLTELGQKGGMLRLVGKLALLWGGIRGAMSLTDRLIKFLRLAERPLAHRILGFIGMVLVLWSPVVLPLMPTLVHNWTTNNSSRVVQLACITGLYAAATLLIVIWGKRIRGYENPLKQYGLDLSSPNKIQEYVVGLAGGIILVLLIQSVNACLGVVEVNWPSSFSASDVGMILRVKSWGKLVTILAQGIVTATFISSVEELVYRSWLPEEISADLGYHRAIILSALAFSLSQRSLQAIPGLWLLSLCLAGVRQRKLGSLYSPIGMRSGVVASCYVLRMEELLTSKPNMPHWLTGTSTFQPFSGAVGLLFSLMLAIILYPREPIPRKNKTRTIRE